MKNKIKREKQREYNHGFLLHPSLSWFIQLATSKCFTIPYIHGSYIGHKKLFCLSFTCSNFVNKEKERKRNSKQEKIRNQFNSSCLRIGMTNLNSKQEKAKIQNKNKTKFFLLSMFLNIPVHFQWFLIILILLNLLNYVRLLRAIITRAAQDPQQPWVMVFVLSCSHNRRHSLMGAEAEAAARSDQDLWWTEQGKQT